MRTENEMSVIKEVQKYTLEDYYSFPEWDLTEMIDGELYDINGGRPTIHQQICVAISSSAANYHRKNKLHWYVLSFINVELNEFTVVIPDIAVICDKNKINERGCEGTPDFIIEIISEHPAHDYVTKLNTYYKCGVREYWIVDPKKETVNVYLLDENYAVKQYQFSDDVPVSIYNGELKINIAELLSE